MGIYDYIVKDINSNEMSLKEFEGKVLLIVNTATGCGFTPQYNALQDLYLKYKDNGFEILDFPCNQFGNQAPGTENEISQICKIRYKITFKQFSKIDVNGENQSPVYKYLKEQKKGFAGSNIKWNFTKFLVNKDGKVVSRYSPTTKPEAIEKDIKKLLGC